MTAEEYLRRMTAELTAAGITSARLDVLILLEDATGQDRSWLLAHPEHPLDSLTVLNLDEKVSQRARHLPLAYIRGRTEFYGRQFAVNHHVLEPRPESETIIELLKSLDLPAEPVIVDVGTGSGALAVTAKLELPQATVYGTDIDQHCLEVSGRNAAALQADVRFMAADLLLPDDHDATLPAPDVILANLPYVPDDWQINQAAMNEPRLAIFGGPDGLDLYRRLFAQIDGMECRPPYILAESLPPQHAMLASIAGEHGYRQERQQDFIQLLVAA